MSVDGTMAGGRGDKRRTALLLAAVAFAFFSAIVVKIWLVGR